MSDQEFCSLTNSDFSNEYNKGVVLLSTLPQPFQVKLKKFQTKKKVTLKIQQRSTTTTILQFNST